MTKNNNLDPGHWFGLFLLVLLLVCVTKCHAQTKTAIIDTMACDVTCIDKYVSETSSTGKTKYYAVYNDYKKDISELIPVSQSVMTYIKLCDTNKITPSLGIRLRNGQISSLIRYRAKYVRTKKSAKI